MFFLILKLLFLIVLSCAHYVGACLREEFGGGSHIRSKASAVFELTESSEKCRNDDHESTSDIDSEEAESNSNVDQTGSLAECTCDNSDIVDAVNN